MKLRNLPQLIKVLIVLGAYHGWAWVLYTFSRDSTLWRQRAVNYTSTMSRILAKLLHFNVTLKGKEHLLSLKDESYLMVANHCSYMDILLLSWQQPASFITSVEMGNTAFLGSITRVGGSLYTQRDKHVSLPEEIKRFAKAIKEGFKVVLFPEGTSTDASTIKAFRTSLFQVAIEAKTKILPVCIRYTSIDGKAFSPENHQLVCWYGDMEFLPHFMKLLGRRYEVEITVLPAIEYDESRTRAELSNIVREQLLDIFLKPLKGEPNA